MVEICGTLINTDNILYVEYSMILGMDGYRLDIHFSNEKLTFYTKDYNEILIWKERIVKGGK